MPFIPLDTLHSGASELGIELSDNQLALMDEFAAFMVETNERLNLTRIINPSDIVTAHYLDSLTCLAALNVPQGAKVIDVGTGAGFPGIPIKIVRPDLHVTLLDATFKKIKFLSDAIQRLGLEGIEPVHARAEEIGREKAFREHYDIAYARALSETRVLAELCLPLVRIGGYVIAQKSKEIDEELAEARAIIGQLGGRVEKTVRTHIPFTEITRQLVVIAKDKPTPQSFPRPYAKIVRSKG
ncbi:MAG: 16S rRNA (guanine(527)-N(7))-methyltransferase RsmG [Armatimonadota bacterium]|nr:16S rRNA (guanine(527)-N(7))-methyltransferase RsmG [bacterium]